MRVHSAYVAEPPEELRSAAPNVGSAIRRNRLIVLLPPIALVAAAVAIGLSRAPVYTAESRLNVGGANVGTQSIPGFVEAATALAGAYSRAIDSPGVTESVARTTGLDRREVGDRLSATPVAESPVFSISAEGTSEKEAVELARAASQSMVDYIARINDDEEAREELLRDYRRASATAQRLAIELARLRRNAGPAGATNQSSRREMNRLAGNLEAARLEARGLATSYQEAAQGSGGRAFVQVLNPPLGASSDRIPFTQRLIAIGLLVGLLIGVALAVVRSGRMIRRAQG